MKTLEFIKGNAGIIALAAVIGGCAGYYIYDRFVSYRFIDEDDIPEEDFFEEAQVIEENTESVDDKDIHLGISAMENEIAKKIIDIYSSDGVDFAQKVVDSADDVENDEIEVHNIFDEQTEEENIPEDQEEWEEVYEASVDKEDYISDVPYPIGYEEFENEHPEYEKMSVLFFLGDRTLATEQDEILDIFDTIGERIVYDMEDIKTNDIFYARNDVNQTDYEIRKLRTTYIEHAIGID